MIERERYEKIIREQVNSGQVKLFTGAYRTGKSTILKMVQRILRKRGIPLGDVLYIDFEAVRHCDIRDGGSLLFVVRNLVRGKHRIYLLLDEVANLPGWEKALENILIQYRCDIYLTGTRASFFGDRQEALFSGKYLEIPVFPYRFREFCEARNQRKTAEPEECLQDFMIYGNMPGIHNMEKNQDTVFSYLLDVCQAGMLQSVVRIWRLRNVDQIWMILGCAAENLGKPLSAKVIAQQLKEENYSIGKDTVYTVLRALTEAGILLKVPRYDRKTGRCLEAQEKYYFTDWGMYHSLYGLHSGRTKALLENIVCMELAARGWQVLRIQQEKDIDFMARKGENLRYLQVREKADTEEAEELLKALPKDGKRTVITLERDAQAETKQDGSDGMGEIKSLLQFLQENDDEDV